MNDGTKALIEFMKYARKKGYKYAIPGDHAYSKRQTAFSRQHCIKLISAKNGKIQILEDGMKKEIYYDKHNS